MERGGGRRGIEAIKEIEKNRKTLGRKDKPVRSYDCLNLLRSAHVFLLLFLFFAVVVVVYPLKKCFCDPNECSVVQFLWLKK